MSELRYHPFLNQWVITATHRQDRTFLPPDDFDPLSPTQPGGFPTEIPLSAYDLVVFENKFPSLRSPAPEPAVSGSELYPVKPASGVCEVVSYTSNLKGSFAELPFEQARKLARVWKERYIELSSRSDVEYVYIFENKGKEIGVTLNHPHGQIYAYPFIPPVPATELEQEKSHLDKTVRPLMEDVIRRACESEQSASTIVWENEFFAVFIPFFARYPYETYVAPKIHMASIAQFNERHLDAYAEALQITAKKLDGLFGFSMPYVMATHQKPAVDGFEWTWFHTEFYPVYRTKEKIKYLAGSESGAGAFINDTLPEVSAERLRAVECSLN